MKPLFAALLTVVMLMGCGSSPKPGQWYQSIQYGTKLKIISVGTGNELKEFLQGPYGVSSTNDLSRRHGYDSHRFVCVYDTTDKEAGRQTCITFVIETKKEVSWSEWHPDTVVIKSPETVYILNGLRTTKDVFDSYAGADSAYIYHGKIIDYRQGRSSRFDGDKDLKIVRKQSSVKTMPEVRRVERHRVAYTGRMPIYTTYILPVKALKEDYQLIQ